MDRAGLSLLIMQTDEKYIRIGSDGIVQIVNISVTDGASVDKVVDRLIEKKSNELRFTTVENLQFSKVLDSWVNLLVVGGPQSHVIASVELKKLPIQTGWIWSNDCWSPLWTNDGSVSDIRELTWSPPQWMRLIMTFEYGPDGQVGYMRLASVIWHSSWPTPQIYIPPLPNVFEDGRCCVGTAATPIPVNEVLKNEGIIPAIEDAANYWLCSGWNSHLYKSWGSKLFQYDINYNQKEVGENYILEMQDHMTVLSDTNINKIVSEFYK